MSAEGADALDGETLETWRSRIVKSAKINGVIDAAVRTIFGAEARDLSLAEMRAWLQEAGFTARVRNGVFETAEFDEALAMLEDSA